MSVSLLAKTEAEQKTQHPFQVPQFWNLLSLGALGLMAANLNIFIRPVEMYLMMASVCPSVSSLQSHRCSNQPRQHECQKKADLVVSGGWWRKLSPDSVVCPRAWRMENEASWCVVCSRVQAPHSTKTVNRLMEKNSLFLSEMELCHLAHCDFLIQRFFSSCVQNWTFLLYFSFIAASSQHPLLLLAHFSRDWSLKSCWWNIFTAVIRNISRQ